MEPNPAENGEDALSIMTKSLNWYRGAAWRARRAYQASEVLVLIVSAAVPASIAVAPHNTNIPAVLGAAAVVLTGLRQAFHWHDNYLRFTKACSALEAERRLYRVSGGTYKEPDTRDELLVSAVSRIEQEETMGWLKIAAPDPKS
jgi:hypothetical protein